MASSAPAAPTSSLGTGGQQMVTLPNGQSMPMSQFATTFANQAVGGGNPYYQGPGSPQASPQGLADANRAGAAMNQPPPPPPPPPPPTPEFMTPEMQRYVDMFHSSQDQMKQALNASLAQAVTGLGQRRDAAAKVVATLPGAADAAYREASASAGNAAKQAAGAFHGPTIGGNNPVNDIAAANAGAKGAAHAAQPLLEAGITADYSKGKTTLDNTNLANLAEWNNTNQQFAMQMAHDQAAFDAATEQQKASMAHDIYMAKLNSTLSTQEYNHEHPGGALTPAQQLKQQEDYYTFQQNSQPAQGDAGKAGFTQGQANTIMASQDWAAAVKIATGQYGLKPSDKGYLGPTQKGESMAAWLTKEYSSYNPDMLRLLLATYPNLATDYPAGK